MVEWDHFEYMSCPELCSYEEYRENTIWKMGEEKANTFLLTYLGLFCMVNGPITKKRKLEPKTVDWVGYAIHSKDYRFLVVKSGVPDKHVGIII